MMQLDFGGCGKIDCMAYPRIDEDGEGYVNDLCKMCCSFKSFNMYSKQPTEVKENDKSK